MSIRLTFTNPNSADSVKIYRATAPISLDALPEPLATLPGDATTFSDVTAVRNTVYYYVIASLKGEDVLFTPSQQYGYFPDTGPGPSRLLRGNWNEGYFGTVAQSELFAPAELCSALGFSPVLSSTTAPWHKFIIDGKILFIPDQSFANTHWYELYNAGLVYGTDDNGAYPTGLVSTPKNQMKTATKSGRTYIVRLLKGSTAPTTEYLTDYSTADGRWVDGEYNRTLGRIGTNAFTFCSRSRLGNKVVNGTTSSAGYTGVLTQHARAAGTVVMFGAITGIDVPGTIGWTTQAYDWRPVLELKL